MFASWWRSVLARLNRRLPKGRTRRRRKASQSTYRIWFEPLEDRLAPSTMNPDLFVTQTADRSSINVGSSAGYTVTLRNTGSGSASGVTLSDPLPAGSSSDINWTIDPSKGNPTDFQITGAVGSQVLSLNPSSITLAAGACISVHYTGLPTANDIATSTNPALNVGGIASYAVVYEGTGNNQLSITNDTVDGNIGVGGGQVQFNGPGTIDGRLDFAAANSGQYHNTNGSNVGPHFR